jgi:hypothetical protein
MHAAPTDELLSPEGCGAPSLWSGDGRATVLSCIGCGRIDTAQRCAGTCGEHRLEIVPAAAHDHTVARLEAERMRAEALVAVTARLAAHASGTDGWEAAYRTLQAEAREVLHALPAAGTQEPEQRLTVWSCGCCGRVEAEAPCVEVCIDEPLDVVLGGVHDEVCGQLESVGSRVRELRGLVGRLAFATPRADGWEASFLALQDRARKLLGDVRVAP